MHEDLLLIVTQASGSVGDTVFARNQHGPYTRARTDPTDPNTGRQQRIRTRWADIVAAWADTLTASQRFAWRVYARQLHARNPDGDRKPLTGQTAFIKLNMSRQTVVFGLVLDPPESFATPRFGIPSANGLAGPGLVVIAFDETDPWVADPAGAMVVFSGRGNPPTVHFYDRPYRRVTTVPGDPGVPPVSPVIRADPYATSMGPHRWIRAYSFLGDGRVSSAHKVQWDV